MRTVTASEANQNFSRLLADAEQGEDIVITRRGRPAVRMAAISDAPSRADRAAAYRAFAADNRKRDHMIVRGWTRDSLYDRPDRGREE